MQKTFKQFLQSESTLLTEGKNIHMTHAEDMIIDRGYEGAVDSIKQLEYVAGLLTGGADSKVKITTKYDGSPALFVGEHPESGKFFVGTKGVFSKKEPKIIYSPADADKLYGDKPDLAEILKLAYKHLKKLNIKGILQGDLMFTSKMFKSQNYEGEKYLTFTPNTITYAVPAESKLADKMKKAEVGIVFHTSYSGDSMDNLSSTFKVDVNKLSKTPDVWVDDVTYKDLSGALMNKKELKAVAHHINGAIKSLAGINKDDLANLKSTYKSLIHMNLNQAIRSGKHIDDPQGHVDELVDFMHKRIDKEKEKKPESADAAERKRERQEKAINEMEPLLLSVFEFQKHINEAKLLLIRKLELVNKMGTFLQDEDGLKVTPQEGFVAVEHLTDKAIKLVDRLNFSAANFKKAAKQAK